MRALILVPTRELAAQVGQTVHALAKPLPVKLKISVLFGGVSINPQMMDLRGGADIVVATPGRLLDLVKHNAVKLGGVSLFVLDEADRLLDMGFTRRNQRHAGAAAGQAPEPVFLGHLPRQRAGAGRQFTDATGAH